MIEWESDKEWKLMGIKDFLDSIFIIFTNVILYIFWVKPNDAAFR